ncbi:MAG: RHS repeat-associated core domain-containing protein [Chloroflexota bacterium]
MWCRPAGHVQREPSRRQQHISHRLPQAVASASYDAANQITQFAGTSYTYDANGSLLGNASSTYTWNARGQLASLTGGGTSASFRYDAFGRRRGRTVNGTATEFLYDGGDVVQELSGSSPTANLLHGPGLDELLQRTDASGTRHLLHDGLGSTLGLLNPSGSFTHTYTYTPFGSTSETVLAGGSSANAARFTGREDDGTGLYFYRARFYHPVLQRFLSEDPLGFAGGDTNLHAYVGNDPVNATDPSGENPLLLACAFGAAQDAALYAGWQYLSGRKITLNGLGGAAVSGCIGGLVGFGVGKLFAAAMPRVAAAIGRGGLGRARGLPNSFSGDTVVATDHGERRIDGLRIGDRVLAYDEESGETSYQLVTATVSHQDAAIVRLMLDGQPLEATPEHPFSIQGRGWVHAEDLHPGDRVLRAFGGTGTVTSVTLKRHLQVMYNLSIDGAHTFFVGDDEWLVHNPGGSATATSGKAAEDIVSNRLGIPHNGGLKRAYIPGWGPSGRVYPDFDPRITIGRFGTVDEVKDLVRLRSTRQLKALLAYAQKNNATLRIHTDAPNPTRGWLADRIAEGKISLTRIRCYSGFHQR